MKCLEVFRPRYKRLVRGLLPKDPTEGLNPVAMEKLYYYALLYPEKMDQVGEYMHERAEKHLRRGQFLHVALMVDALAQLLRSADPRGRELLVDSFLKIVLMCLASRHPRLQVISTYCFIRFVVLKDETLYDLNYEQLLTEFAEMCRNKIKNREIREEIRHAGIEGLEAVLMWCDALLDNIYSPTYMDLILPCLLYNFNDHPYLRLDTQQRRLYSTNPPGIAEACMKEFIVRSASSRLQYVLTPILRYFDDNFLWLDELFSFELFKLLIISVEPQYAYLLIERLVRHASPEVTVDPRTRVRILETVMEIAVAASEESVGPAAFYCVGKLLHDLVESVKRFQNEKDEDIREDEELYQDALVKTLETIAFTLPDFYKLETMVYIVNNTPFPSKGIVDAKLRYILLDVVSEVSKQYKTFHLNTSVPMSLLRPLLHISLSPNPHVRLTVHGILHNLIDRHGNIEKLREPTTDVSNLDLKIQQCSPLDVAFMRKHALIIFYALYQGLDNFHNSLRNLKAVYTTSALFIVEAVSETTLIDTLRFLINIQDLANERKRGKLFKSTLQLIVSSLTGLLVLTVPTASALDEEGPPPLTLLAVSLTDAGTLLYRPRVVESLRRDGWLGVTERHLGAYSETLLPTWPRNVTTVMHMTILTNPRYLSPIPSSRFRLERQSHPALPAPVSPRVVEGEERWTYLTEVLMLADESVVRDEDLEEEDSSTCRVTCNEDEEEEEEEEDTTSTSEEDSTVSSSSSGRPHAPVPSRAPSPAGDVAPAQSLPAAGVPKPLPESAAALSAATSPAAPKRKIPPSRDSSAAAPIPASHVATREVVAPPTPPFLDRSSAVVTQAVGATESAAAAPARRRASPSAAKDAKSRRSSSVRSRNDGAAVLGRFKAEAAIETADARLKFAERQAQLRLRFRTQHFSRLVPPPRSRRARADTDGRSALSVALDAILQKVPDPPPTPPSPPPPPPYPPAAVRKDMLPFIGLPLSDGDSDSDSVDAAPEPLWRWSDETQ